MPEGPASQLQLRTRLPFVTNRGSERVLPMQTHAVHSVCPALLCEVYTRVRGIVRRTVSPSKHESDSPSNNYANYAVNGITPVADVCFKATLKFR
jgi:hypothetical protein